MILRLVKTCGACPESYNVYDGNTKIGYMRVRHDYFRAEYHSVVVYQSDIEGDGCFLDDERPYHLSRASAAIIEAHSNLEKNYVIED